MFTEPQAPDRAGMGSKTAQNIGAAWFFEFLGGVGLGRAEVFGWTGHGEVTNRLNSLFLERYPQLNGKKQAMNREQAISVLRDHEPELKAIGVVSASVFGSVARDDSGPDSDIDVVVRLSDDFSEGGFDHFGRMEELEQRLSVILGRKVDAIAEPVRKERLRAEIDRDRVFAF